MASERFLHRRPILRFSLVQSLAVFSFLTPGRWQRKYYRSAQRQQRSLQSAKSRSQLLFRLHQKTILAPRGKQRVSSGFCADNLALSPCFLSRQRSQRGYAATETRNISRKACPERRRRDAKAQRKKRFRTWRSWRLGGSKSSFLRVLLRKYPFGDENEEARLGSVIPAKAGIQVNSARRTWIPACAGQPSNLGLIRPSAEMTSRGERHGEGNPSIFILGGRA